MNTLLQFAQSTEYYTYTTSSSDVDPATAAAVIAGAVFFYFLFVAVMYVISALLLGRIFKKAGIASWSAWVPVYNSWRLLEVGGQQGFWAVLMFVPVVNIVSVVFMYIAMYNIGLKLGKSGAFVLLAIFLPIVWLIWLAVDQSTWNDSLGEASKAAEHRTGINTPPTTVI